jgi:carboxyl-terminal processing protease
MTTFSKAMTAAVRAFAVGAALSWTAAGAAAQTVSISPELALATFDSAWNRINTTHYDTSFAGVDWEAVRAELRPAAAQSESLGSLRAVIRDMLSRLGESHYTLIPYDLVDAMDPGVEDAGGGSGGLGIEMALVEGRLVVWRVDRSGAAALAGVRPGWVVESIGSYRPADALARMTELEEEGERRNALTQFLYAARAQAEGPAGSVVEATFLDGRDRALTLRLERRLRPGEVVRFGALPPFVSHVEHWRVPDGVGCIGVIRFNVWMAPLAAKIDEAVDRVRNCRGIVMDLRGNPGGVAGMVMGVAGHFISERVALGTMRRRGTELNFVANPRRVDTHSRAVEPFAGPLAILIDGMSVSTSEIFAGGMQAVGRARVFGQTSAGQALPAGTYRLPDGDVLMHVIADFTAAGGTRIEGRGVIPDVVVEPGRRDLLNGGDPVLDAAVGWIRGGPDSG